MPWYRLTHIETFEETYAGSLDGIGPEWVAEEISGEPPVDPGYVLDENLTWVLPLEVQKGRVRAEVNRLRDEHQNWIAPSPFGPVQCDEVSKTKINGLVSMATLAKSSASAFGVNFTMADNTRVPLDADGMISLGVAVGQYVMDCHDHATALKDAIEAAADEAALAAIDIEGNWP